jgi:hypothetical protein
MQRYLDWGHLFENAKRALSRSGITKREEVDQYMSDLRSLFQKSTELKYHKRYSEILSDEKQWIQVSSFTSIFQILSSDLKNVFLFFRIGIFRRLRIITKKKYTQK